jgi:Tol biopolymer transport system component
MTDVFSNWRKLNLMKKLLTAVLMMAGAAWAESGQDLFQKALVAERANGKLEEAIKLYQRITQKFASDRSLAAKALLQMGQCYEKLGDTQARKAYDRVVREYPDQAEVVAAARSGLGRLGSGTENHKPDGVNSRRIIVADGVNHNGLMSVSPDGRYVSFEEKEGQSGSLAILDLAKGEKRVVKQLPDKNNAWAPIFSPDSQQIAYALGGNGVVELRIVSIDGSGDRVAYRSQPNVGLALKCWNGGYIGAITYPKDQTRKPQIVAVSLADGSARILKSFDRTPGGPSVRLSPDGRWVATSLRNGDGRSRTLFLISTADGREVSLLKQTDTDEEVSGWTPDGKALLYTSTADGHNNLYGLRVEDGKAVGAPVLIRTDMHDVHTVGVSRQGSLYYNSWTGSNDNVFTAALNLATGHIESAPKLATSLSIGENSMASWSPDGSEMAYLTGRYVEGSGKRLAILNVATGAVREFPLRLQTFAPRQWRPDSKAIVGTAESQDGKRGIFTIDPQTGDLAPLVLPESTNEALLNPLWNPDGKSIVYRIVDPSKGGVIISRNLSTGRTRELFRSPLRPNKVFALALSPEGSQLAFVHGNSLLTLSMSGGEPRTILEVKAPESIQNQGGVAWMPDSRRLLFTKQTASSRQSPYTVWTVPAVGGEPENTGLTVKLMQYLSVHPDGRSVLFSANADITKPETWVVEGFTKLLQ